MGLHGDNFLRHGACLVLSSPLDMGGFWRSAAAHPRQNLVQYPPPGVDPSPSPLLPFSWWCPDSVNQIWAFSSAHIISRNGWILQPANLSILRHYWPRYPGSMLRHCICQHHLKGYSLQWPSCWVEIRGFHTAGQPTCHPNLAKLWPPRQCSLLTRAMCSTLDR